MVLHAFLAWEKKTAPRYSLKRISTEYNVPKTLKNLGKLIHDDEQCLRMIELQKGLDQVKLKFTLEYQYTFHTELF